MRKITSFLVMFLLMIGAASAQQPQTSDAPVDGQWAQNTTWYFIQFVNSDSYHTNGYLGTEGSSYVNDAGVLLLNGTTKPVNNGGLWCVVGNETDGYQFYNKGKGTGFVLGITGGLAKMYATSATEGISTAFDYAASTATFTGDLANGSYATYKIHGSTNGYWNNSDHAPKCHLSIWDDGRALGAPGSAIQFTEVTAEELEQIEALTNALTNAIQPTTIINGQFAENTQWYRLKIRSTKKVLTDILSEENRNNANNDNTTYTGLYAFTGDLNNGFQIYNCFVGAGKGLTGEGNNNEILKWTENPSTFFLRKNTANGYQFQLEGEGTKYINDVKSQLGIWTDSNSAADEGSTFTFEAVTDMDAVQAAWAAVAEAVYEEANTWATSPESANLVGTNPGTYRQEDLTLLQTNMQKYSTEENRTLEQMRACVQEYKAFKDSYILPEAGKYYRLICAYQGFETGSQKVRKAIQNNGGGLGWATASEDNTNISQIWTLAPVSGGFAMQSLRDDKYPAVQGRQSSNYGMSVPSTVTRLNFLGIGTGQFNILTVGSHSSFHTGGHRGGAGVSGNIVAYGGGANSQSAWYIEEITVDPLALAKMQLRAFHDDNVSTFPVVAADVDQVIWPGEYNFPSVADKADLFTNALALSSEGKDLAAVNQAVTDIRNYRDLGRSYGNPASVTYEFKAEYGTIMLPGNIAVPAGVKAYTCSGADENGVLNLSDLPTGFKANTPYIVQGEVGKKYQLIGYNASNNQANTAGILTGVYESTTAPVGSYVLQNKGGKLGFYKVMEGEQPTVGANRCYVTLTAEDGEQSAVRALFFSGDVTGIGAVGNECPTDAPAVYDLSGRRVEKMQKGVYIIGGKKVLVK